MGLFGNVSSDLRDRLMKEGTGSKKDTRYVPYFQMNEGEQMEVLLLPDGGDSGDFSMGYKNHSLKNVFGLKTINCPRTSSGEQCAICSHGWNLYKENNKESRNWLPSQHYLAQCLVLKAPSSVAGTNTGVTEDNVVKLLMLPISVRDMAKEAIINETLDDPTEHILVLKKTKNKGGYASYEKSFFKTAKVQDSDYPPEIIKAIEEDRVKLYNFIDIVPASTSEDESKAWLDKALGLSLARNKDVSGPPNGYTPSVQLTNAPQDGDETTTEHNEPSAQDEAATGNSLRDRILARRKASS